MPEDMKRGSFAEVMEGLEDELDVEDDTVEELGDVVEDIEEAADAEETVEEEVSEDEDADTEEDIEEEVVDDESDSDSDEDVEGASEEASEPESDEDITWTVKVDGKEREVDEEELLRGYQNAKASTTRYTEAKQLHSEVQALTKALLDKPGDALTSFLVKKHKGDRVAARTEVRDLFLEFLAPDLEESLIEDEKERDMHRQRRDMAEERAELDRQKNEARGRLEQQAQNEFISDLRIKIDTNITKFKLPKDKIIVNRAADLLEAAEAAGSSNEELIALVPTVMESIRDERLQAARAMAKTLSAEQIEEMYPEQMQALKKKRVDRLKKKKAGKAKKKDEDVEPKPKRKRRRKPEVQNSLYVFNSINLDDLPD